MGGKPGEVGVSCTLSGLLRCVGGGMGGGEAWCIDFERNSREVGDEGLELSPSRDLANFRSGCVGGGCWLDLEVDEGDSGSSSMGAFGGEWKGERDIRSSCCAWSRTNEPEEATEIGLVRAPTLAVAICSIDL